MDATSTSRYRAAESALWRSVGAEPSEHWVDVPVHGIRVRVLEAGSGSPVLFVHGLPTAGSIWAGLVARIRGHRCLVVDRPGCGLSEPLPMDRMASWPALVDVQAAVLEGLGMERVDLVGSSLGGACVLRLAAALPGRVDRIVLEGAPAIAGIRPTSGYRLLAAGPLGRLMARRRWSDDDIRTSFRLVGHGRLLATGWPPEPKLRWAGALYNETDTLHNEVALLQVIESWRGFRRSRLLDPGMLSDIDRPTLWMWGANDPLATTDQGRDWAARMPSARFELFTGAGHLPWLDDPVTHARLIEGFLADRSGIEHARGQEAPAIAAGRA